MLDTFVEFITYFYYSTLLSLKIRSAKFGGKEKNDLYWNVDKYIIDKPNNYELLKLKLFTLIKKITTMLKRSLR